jgi:hypothetical protein
MSTPAEAVPLKPPPRKMTMSHKVLCGMVGFLVLAKLIELAVHLPFQNASQQAIFSWKLVAFFSVLAILGSGFAHIIGFPGMWDPGVNNRQRIWTPVVAGVALGAAMLAVVRATAFDSAYAAALHVPNLRFAFPYSLLFYVYAGVCSAILYCLFPIAFTVWFFGTLLLARRWPGPTFWTMAILVSLWEPLTMAGQQRWVLVRSHPLPAGILAVLALIYVTDIIAAYLFRRFGFLSALALRLSAFVVWHIIGAA